MDANERKGSLWRRSTTVDLGVQESPTARLSRPGSGSGAGCGRNPCGTMALKPKAWIPAFAGMTSLESFGAQLNPGITRPVPGLAFRPHAACRPCPLWRACSNSLARICRTGFCIGQVSPPYTKTPAGAGVFVYGGETGIRTLERNSPQHAFQACALNRSAISPFFSARATIRGVGMILGGGF